VLGRHISYFIENHSDSTKNFYETDIINMLEFLIDNIVVLFGGHVFQQTVGFCRKVSFLIDPHCRFRDVGQGMKQTYLYLWYPLFQA
jgi:hypothetical protein